MWDQTHLGAVGSDRVSKRRFYDGVGDGVGDVHGNELIELNVGEGDQDSGHGGSRCRFYFFCGGDLICVCERRLLCIPCVCRS